jgi:hypothetical protein
MHVSSLCLLCRQGTANGEPGRYCHTHAAQCCRVGRTVTYPNGGGMGLPDAACAHPSRVGAARRGCATIASATPYCARIDDAWGKRVSVKIGSGFMTKIKTRASGTKGYVPLTKWPGRAGTSATSALQTIPGRRNSSPASARYNSPISVLSSGARGIGGASTERRTRACRIVQLRPMQTRRRSNRPLRPAPRRAS